MAINQLIATFNGGELSPFLDARTDIDKYRSGCQELENFIPTPYGGVMRRPGLQYVSDAKEDETRCRLIPFVFSETTRYVVELGEEYARVYNADDLSVVDGLVTPYVEADLREVQFVQVNDIMYFAHQSYPVQKLTRTGVSSFTWTEVVWDYPPFMDFNTTDTTVSASASAGASITLTASTKLNGMVDGWAGSGSSHRKLCR